MRWFLIAALAFVLASPAAAGPPKSFVFHDAPEPVPALQFTDDAGRPQTLDIFRGRVVLLNVWASWCLPCRKEMPTLDRLQATLGGPDFEVVALSIDRGGPDAVKKFYAETGVQHLAIHVDATSQAGFALVSFGLPTTLLVDPQGRELGRLVGPAEWDAPDMTAFLRSVIALREDGLVLKPQKE
ncbi:TlpA family protein disulfide reductase [Rhizobium leguminosarum]|uniref:TlpA family protein disulfide reductase n=1 Tax=Rhizobium leguminosarum TaxID=384 RepID=UPI00098F988E|nr:TlpA disulfide reductase family protein [Rhizobium leguminosarum]MBB5256033.1 thiol-disulfide isomerase/thioredoxin [Rhizobium leguminosarum]MDX6001347.1 TlpA disulfide reductase family protein [Rhizobium leguminosarum]OOO44006.1 redoxin [Rhizobium leguminosarum bv. viciae USDA 2370]PUB63258.1 TlpA family protein disulfide reductase [Rhizobium leguminosarum bv. viciae USDA 2370]